VRVPNLFDINRVEYRTGQSLRLVAVASIVPSKGGPDGCLFRSHEAYLVKLDAP